MARTTFLAVVIFGFLSGTAVGQQLQKPPSGPPPQLLTISAVQQQTGEFSLTAVTARFVWESRQQQGNQDGTNPPRTQPIRRTVYETRGSTITLPSAKFFDVDGRELDLVDVWRRAIPGATVAVSADGKMVDRAYRNALSKNTLIVLSDGFAVNNVLQFAPAGAALPGVPSGESRSY